MDLYKLMFAILIQATSQTWVFFAMFTPNFRAHNLNACEASSLPMQTKAHIPLSST